MKFKVSNQDIYDINKSNESLVRFVVRVVCFWLVLVGDSVVCAHARLGSGNCEQYRELKKSLGSGGSFAETDESVAGDGEALTSPYERWHAATAARLFSPPRLIIVR